MKAAIYVLSLAFLCVISLTTAMPALKEGPEVLSAIGDTETYTLLLDRHSRATCDLLSFSTKIGSLNHSACAAHCLVMGKGYKGGRCRDGVCHCRK